MKGVANAQMVIRECVEQWLLGDGGPSRQEVFTLARGWVRSARPDLSEWELDEKAEDAQDAVREALDRIATAAR